MYLGVEVLGQHGRIIKMERRRRINYSLIGRGVTEEEVLFIGCSRFLGAELFQEKNFPLDLVHFIYVP